ncbi:hypothetical protein ALC53_09488 [Atta colombica]|uniref:Mos1 transposase HTH domain-containing protein n=1 Tax=Atta colombica TaxID=520822 RepID=A0A151I1T3_9HYME|nr:hypothetical protein ALC53_09488 [Atta colombica]
MREALLFCFNLKKSAAESHRCTVKGTKISPELERRINCNGVRCDGTRNMPTSNRGESIKNCSKRGSKVRNHLNMCRI